MLDVVSERFSVPTRGWLKRSQAALQRFMKSSFIISFALLLVGCASTRLGASPAQRSDAPTRFEEMRAKPEKGEPEAQFNLGVCYHDGRGVARDYVESGKWTLLAAAQGH
jgi:TPR repeat protein